MSIGYYIHFNDATCNKQLSIPVAIFYLLDFINRSSDSFMAILCFFYPFYLLFIVSLFHLLYCVFLLYFFPGRNIAELLRGLLSRWTAEAAPCSCSIPMTWWATNKENIITSCWSLKNWNRFRKLWRPSRIRKKYCMKNPFLWHR